MLKVTVHDGEDTEGTLHRAGGPWLGVLPPVTQEQGDRQRVGGEGAAALSPAALIPSGTQSSRNAPPRLGKPERRDRAATGLSLEVLIRKSRRKVSPKGGETGSRWARLGSG